MNGRNIVPTVINHEILNQFITNGWSSFTSGYPIGMRKNIHCKVLGYGLGLWLGFRVKLGFRVELGLRVEEKSRALRST